MCIVQVIDIRCVVDRRRRYRHQDGALFGARPDGTFRSGLCYWGSKDSTVGH